MLQTSRNPVRVLLALITTLLFVGCTTTSHWPDTVRTPDGAALRYEVHGEGEPTLVFVHGWSCHRQYWNEQIRRFGQVRRVVALDLMGHGESDASRTDWTIEAFGDDVVRVCDALALERVILVGHSMGGPVCLVAAQRLGKRCVAVVGVDTLRDVSMRIAPEAIEPFLAKFRADFAGTMDEFVRQQLFPKDADPDLVDLVAGRMSARPPEIAVPILESMLRFDEGSALAAVDVPVHCIQSESEKHPTNLAANQARNPRYTFVVMPGVGHFPMLEEPERFARVLADFVRPLGDG